MSASNQHWFAVVAVIDFVFRPIYPKVLETEIMETSKNATSCCSPVGVAVVENKECKRVHHNSSNEIDKNTQHCVRHALHLQEQFTSQFNSKILHHHYCSLPAFWIEPLMTGIVATFIARRPLTVALMGRFMSKTD